MNLRPVFQFLKKKAFSCHVIRYDSHIGFVLQGGSNTTGTDCDLFTHKSSRSYLNHLVL
jgi:hypothetical protein